MTPAEMAALHAACFTTPRPWSAAEIASLLDSPHTFALTEANAFLLGRVVAGEAELLTLAVAPDQRRQGIASRLMQSFLTECRARTADSVFLEVAEPNLPARALYAAHGFTQSGLRRAYYHTPDGQAQDALVLVRSL